MPQAPYSPCVYLGKVGLLGGMPSDEEGDSKPPAKRQSPNLDDELTMCNKKARDGERWVQGPCIQLPGYANEETYHWNIPRGYTFLKYKVLGNNTDDTEIAIKQNQGDYALVDQEASTQCTENKIESSVGGQEQEEVAGRSNASLEMTVSRKTKASDKLSGHKNDSNANDLLVMQVLLCLKEVTVISHQASIDPEEIRHNLRKHYSEKFAHVPSLFGEAEKSLKEIRNLQLTLQLISPADQKGKYEDTEDDVATPHARREYKKEAIALEDLFRRRSTQPEEAVREINKVLVVGGAGMGKTTLSKKIAYLWARGEWGKEFAAVYVLPVQALQKSQYDDTSYRREATLPTAIVNLCFTPPTNEATYKALRAHVDDELAAATTLVVLDGLDERSGVSEALLSQAKTGKNKLLMLSRSHGMAEERTLADIEIENTGLSEQQMRDYVIDENLSGLPEGQSKDFILQLARHPSISDIARVPVNLEILCLLWRDRKMQAIVSQAMGQGSLSGLYRVLTQYIWERYATAYVTEEEKPALRVTTANQAGLPIDHHDDPFDTLGKIAVKAFEKEEILINQSLVQELVQGSVLEHLEVMQHADCLLLQRLEGSGQYQFSHLTFQEYFAGRWLAKQLFSKNKDEKEKAELFFKTNKYDPWYGKVFSFMTGEVSEETGQEGIRQLLSLTNEGVQEVLGLHHISLQMRLLNEWLCLYSKKEEEVKIELRELEKAFKILTSFKKWFVKGTEVIRKHEGSALLRQLTNVLQDVHAVAGYVAPQCFEVLLAGVKDESVRQATLNALGHLAKTAPDIAPQCLPFLFTAVKNEDKDVCKAALRALATVAQAVPDMAPRCLEVLLTAAQDDGEDEDEDESGDIRWAALYAFLKVAQAVPDVAPQCLPFLLTAVQDENENVRQAALGTLVAVTQTVPDVAPQCLPFLLTAVQDENENVRQAALETLVAVTQTVPDMAPQCLEVLLTAIKDEDGEVRWVTLKALGQVAEAAPDLANQCLPSLLAAIKDKDENEEVREVALEALGKVTKAAPDVAPQCLSSLLAAIEDKDENEDIREAALEALGQVAQAAPDLGPQCFEALLTAIKDDKSILWATQKTLAKVAQTNSSRYFPSLLAAVKDEDIRGAALEALAKVTQEVPDMAPQCLEVLLAAVKDEDKNVRWVALEALGQVAQAVPDVAPQCLSSLLAAVKDENVRRAALEVLAKVAPAVPDMAPQCLEVLLAAVKYEDKNIRGAALRALAEVVQAAPDMAPQCLSSLLAAAMDKDIRWVALEVLAKVAQTVPDIAPQCFSFLLAAAMDMDKDAREVALRALRQVSLEHLINSYWATQQKNLLASIIRQRLYQTPLVVIPGTSDSQWCLVLYQTTGVSKKWGKPKKEIKQFVSSIKEGMGMSHTSREKKYATAASALNLGLR
jgi:HEAT repeat protein